MMGRWIFSAIFAASMLVAPNTGLAQILGPQLIPIRAFCASGPPTKLFMGFMEHGAIPTHRLVLEGVGTLYIVHMIPPAVSSAGPPLRKGGLSLYR